MYNAEKLIFEMIIMKTKVTKVLEIWHKRFEDEALYYSEFESSDIEYFVGCLLYNHFAFSKALDTMKTIDLSYDFIESCGDEFDGIMDTIKTITFDTEVEKLEFLQNYIEDSKAKYNDDELYLINRLAYHIDGMAQRYRSEIEAQKVEFKAPKPKVRSANPLLR